MNRLHLKKAFGIAALATLGLAAPAIATDGAFYEVGWRSALAPQSTPEWSTGIFGDEFALSAPSGAFSAGDKWWMTWNGCPQPGMIGYSIRWSSNRTQASTSARLGLFVNGGAVTNLVNLPIRPTYAAYEGGLGGSCVATLKINQLGGGTEPGRAYWIANPRAVFQDVWAPGVNVTYPGAGLWITAGTNQLTVNWAASDNMGSDGIGQQRVYIAEQLKWAGNPGESGGHSIVADLAAVPDGTHNVRVEADGDGTGGASHSIPVNIDRTPPQSHSLSHGYSGAAGVATFAWTATDPSGFGVQQSTVQVNAATDGSVGATWVNAATRVGAGALVAIDTPLSNLVGNGLHAWRVVTTDVAGNTHVIQAPGTVLVDTTAPSVDLDPAPAGYVSQLAVGFGASDNLQAALGLGNAEITVNTSTDGSATGAWTSLTPTPTAATPGRNTRQVSLTGLQDGLHLMQLRVRNGAPFQNALATDRSIVVKVDNSSPVFPEPPTFTRPTPGSVQVAFVAHDALAGVARATLEWRDGTVWRPLADQPMANGAGSLTGDTGQLPEGAITYRLVVTDAAGNVATSSSALGVDRTAPSVRGLALVGGPPWTLRFTQTDTGGGFGACPTQIRVSGPATGLAWKEIASTVLGEGPHEVVLPLEGLAAGDYRVGVVACDAAGNTTSAETAGLVLSAAEVAAIAAGEKAASTGGAGRPATDPLAAIRGARLSLTMDKARVVRRAGRTVLVRRIPFGTRVTVGGALRHGSTLAGIAGAEIEVRSPQGRVIGRGETDRAGRFSIPIRPDASGLLRVGVPAEGALLPGQAEVDLRVAVVPTVTLSASSRHATALGAPIELRGRVTPAPHRVGATKKAIVLEWHDPVRGTWRPVLNHTTRADGRFRLSWRFQTPGLNTRLRVRVLPERGWPLEAAVSRSLAIRVR